MNADIIQQLAIELPIVAVIFFLLKHFIEYVKIKDKNIEKLTTKVIEVVEDNTKAMTTLDKSIKGALWQKEKVELQQVK